MVEDLTELRLIGKWEVVCMMHDAASRQSIGRSFCFGGRLEGLQGLGR